MIRTSILAAAGLVLSGPVLAQGTSLADDTRIVRGVSLADIDALVTAEGHTVLGKDAEGVTVSAETSDGLRFLIDGTACDDVSMCLGVNMIVQYALSDRATEEILNRADVKYAAASVWQSDGNVGISRYVILDGGMTMANLKVNLQTLLAIAPKVDAFVVEESAPPETPDDINFGDDSGSDANDSVCDDGRFHPDGDAYTYTRQHVLRDATDCREAVRTGLMTLTLDFGDDSGTYANDGECDDNRFSGEGRSELTAATHVKKDATDCVAAYRAGTISR